MGTTTKVMSAPRASRSSAEHVIVAKAPLAVHTDPALQRPTNRELTPGTRVAVLQKTESGGKVSAEVATSNAIRGWVDAKHLKALPTVRTLGICSHCNQELPQSAFSKSNRRRLRQGSPATCEHCSSSAANPKASVITDLLLSSKSTRKPSLRAACSLAAVAAFIATVRAVEDPAMRLGIVCMFSFLTCWMLYRNFPRDSKEQNLQDRPLRLVGRDGSREHSLMWECCVCDERNRSFASLRRSPFSKDQLSTWFHIAETATPWQQPETRTGRLLPRKAAWFVREGCTCTYEYNGTQWPAVNMPQWLLDIEAAVWEVVKGDSEPFERPNSCVANFYEDGLQSVDWHADNEPLFEGTCRDCCIISLSLGETRKFELRQRRSNSAHRQCVSLELCDGDIVTMEGLFQKHWDHRVPRQGDVLMPRINFTWRSITAHCSTCAQWRSSG